MPKLHGNPPICSINSLYCESVSACISHMGKKRLESYAARWCSWTLCLVKKGESLLCLEVFPVRVARTTFSAAPERF